MQKGAQHSSEDGVVLSVFLGGIFNLTICLLHEHATCEIAITAFPPSTCADRNALSSSWRVGRVESSMLSFLWYFLLDVFTSCVTFWRMGGVGEEKSTEAEGYLRVCDGSIPSYLIWNYC